MLRIYKEHKVNPFGGCLADAAADAVLLALFFVFANTIAFRGVRSCGSRILSRPDPFKIIPIIMGLSMSACPRWARSVCRRIRRPDDGVLMPIVLTLLFLNFASGLNLYYAAQNLFSIPSST